MRGEPAPLDIVHKPGKWSRWYDLAIHENNPLSIKVRAQRANQPVSLAIVNEICRIEALLVWWLSRPTPRADNNRSFQAKVQSHKLVHCLFTFPVSHVYMELSVTPPSLSNFVGNLVKARRIEGSDFSAMLCRSEEIVPGRTGAPSSSDHSLLLLPGSDATVSAILSLF